MAWIYIVSFKHPKVLTLKWVLIHTGGKARLPICANQALPLPLKSHATYIFYKALRVKQPQVKPSDTMAETGKGRI